MKTTTRSVAGLTTSFALMAASLALSSAASAAPIQSTAVFDWNQRVTAGTEVSFAIDTTTAAEGETSLRIDSATPRAPERYGELNQDVVVEPETTYVLSGWFRGEDLPANAATLVTSNDWVQRLPLPSGTYDWQEVTWELETTPGETVHTWRLLMEDTGTLWLDDLSMSRVGSEENLLANPSFEEHSDPGSGTAISVTSDALVFAPGEAEVSVTTALPEIGYRISDVDGVTVSQGMVDTTSGDGVVDATRLGVGYYGLHLESSGVDATSVDTSFAILEEVPASARGTDSPFGISFHPDEYATPGAMSRDFGPLGTSHARLDYPWSLVEREKGVYTFPERLDNTVAQLEADGVRPLLILNYRNKFYDDNRTPSTPEGLAAWGDYAAAVAGHFGDRVDYEIYNEFNHHFNDGLCGQTPECYYELMVAATDRIRDVEPDATIAGPAIVYLEDAHLDWLTRFAQIGGLTHLDALSFHPYNHPAGPDVFQPEAITGVRQLIDDYAEPNHEVEIWVTEVGWPTRPDWTTEHQQANYIPRYFAGSLAAGADRSYWYEVTDAGTDSSDLEQVFGMMRHHTDAVGTYAPKPGYVAYGVAARLLADAAFVGADNLADGAYGYAFDGGSAGPLHVLWATDGQDVTVNATSAVTVVDPFGRASVLNPQDGELTLSLSERPVYVLGEVESVAPAPETVYGISAPDLLALDSPVEIDLSVDHRGHTEPVAGPVTFRANTGEQIIVPARAGELTSETLTIVPTSTPGERAITVDVLVGGEVVMQRQLIVTVVDHRSTFRVTPRIDEVDPLNASVEVTVSNSSIGSALDIVDVTWEVDGAEAEGENTASIPVGGSATLEASVPGAKLWRDYPYSATVTFSDGIVRTLTGSLGFNPVPPEGERPDLAVDLLEFGREVTLEAPSTGPDDLSGSVRLSWTSDGLVVEAAVIDDMHDNTVAPGDMWQADSIQFAFSPTLPQEASSYVEIGAALGPDGPAVHRFSGQAGPVSTADVTISRDDEARRTDYRVELEWSELGLDAESSAFGFSFLVNDADGAGRAGYLEWGSGIGESKDPSQFNPMLVTESEPELPDLPSWDASAAYPADSRVIHQGSVYLATWWTQGEQPGGTNQGAWQEILSGPDGVAVWTPSRVFTGGDLAWHNGILYQAAWWNREQDPSAGGPWSPVE